MKRIFVVLAAVVLSLSACSSDDDEMDPFDYLGSEQNSDDLAEAYGYDRVSEPVSEPVSDPASDVSDEKIADLALELTWDSLSYIEQDDFCWGWEYDKNMMLDAFMEGAEDSISRSQVNDFFNGKC